MANTVLLTDRTPEETLPALAATGADVKTEALSITALDRVAEIGPEVLAVDAAENPGQGFSVLLALRELETRPPTVAVVERSDLDRFPWHQVADEVLFPAAPESEIRVRLAILKARLGGGGGSTVRLGPLSLDADSFRVAVAGRPIDLTYKEFELLRYLVSRPGRVFTRPALLREVWGYDFYGGTRTVDVHVRRLRAKLGPEHEYLIETVRGVGYRAADIDQETPR